MVGTEALIGLNNSHVDKLEQVDRIFFRRLFLLMARDWRTSLVDVLPISVIPGTGQEVRVGMKFQA